MLYAKGTTSVTLSPEQLEDFRSFKTQCNLDKLDLDSNKRILDKCLTDSQCKNSWSESKTFVGAGVITALLLGFLAGSVNK